ncbi:UDP-N-acetylmuramate--L-alanine ligase [Thermosulfurimonas marina]|uniref:UDP-N-acetylmuramate--L-alanine ligase n=1 Tax=Thermosulfurimonas marina TaxID=2047767 RepID=A0A6H1WRB1_9BACT|nr:UDP-N-acetylmuramate--L-alanine ligase [Thermosulfurimonas marina]QJA05757.1 UDP-N-acetylmuramate--L-alanine ligase [Thermosulfurimonas marina]
MLEGRVFHFMGIGGVGMSGLARLLAALGARVTGCDLRVSETTRSLEREGIPVWQGHDPAHLEGTEILVYSSAIRPDHPEIQAARRQGLKVWPRAEMLAEIMGWYPRSIAVAGAHGKTTTSSMIAEMLAVAGLEPTVIIGGRVNCFGSNARLGRGEYLVAETDESDGSFLYLQPYLAVITNVDREHLDFYADFRAVKRAFVKFARRVSPEGALVVCGDDPGVRTILPELSGRLVTYGFSEGAEVRGEILAEAPLPRVRVWWRGQALGEFSLRVPGRHNAENALAAVAVGLTLGLPSAVILSALSGFSGVGRRLEFKGEVLGAFIYDDYAHHPREIAATLAAIRALHPERRLLAVFQPHRYSRTRALWQEFVRVLAEPEVLFLTEIYPAAESPLPGVSGEKFFQAVRRVRGGKPTLFAPDLETLRAQVEFFLSPGDLLLTLGAGDVYQLGEALVRQISPSRKEKVVG